MDKMPMPLLTTDYTGQAIS